MKIVLASNAGTCFGVQRALDLAEEVAASGKPAVTLGPLIHNPRVVGGLEERGVRVVAKPEDVDTPIVVIRSHGVLPEVLDGLRARDLEVVDATCPYVARAQRKAAKLASAGNDVVIVGEQGHPEVEGLTAWAKREGARVIVASSAHDLPDDLGKNVGVVVQTTQRESVLEEITDALKARGIAPWVENTICFATTERQTSAAKLADEVDAMVVLGGRNSSNTTRLAEICRAVCARTFHVESPDELRREDFEGCVLVGVTAGASTPKSQIAEIICTLEAF